MGVHEFCRDCVYDKIDCYEVIGNCYNGAAKKVKEVEKGMHAKCEECKHFDVCKYVSEFKTLIDNVNAIELLPLSIFRVSIGCSKWENKGPTFRSNAIINP